MSENGEFMTAAVGVRGISAGARASSPASAHIPGDLSDRLVLVSE